MKIKSPRDFFAGAMFIVVGLGAAVWAATSYQIGTAVQMGPGYFPVLLGGLLAVIGGVVLAGSLTRMGAPVPRFDIRPLVLLLGGTVAFGYLIEPLGLVLAAGVLIFICALGGRQFRWQEVSLLFLVLAVFSVLVFVKALGLPLPLWPEAFE